MTDQKRIEVCFSPAIYHRFHNPDAIVVIVDVLRATSAICTAFLNGVERIIPVESIEEAKKYKKKGFLVAAERDGNVLDFADFGNSPHNFSSERVNAKEIVYSTTNGTQAIHLARESHMVVIGSFLNLSALAHWIISENHDVVILCSGWKERFSLEDTIFAGALSQQLIDSGKFATICDSSLAACDLWSLAKDDLLGYIQKAAQRGRLKKIGQDDAIEFCHQIDITDKIPVMMGDSLMELKYCEKSNNFGHKKI